MGSLQSVRVPCPWGSGSPGKSDLKISVVEGLYSFCDVNMACFQVESTRKGLEVKEHG